MTTCAILAASSLVLADPGQTSLTGSAAHATSHPPRAICYAFRDSPYLPYSAQRVVEHSGVWPNGKRFDVKEYPSLFARDSLGRTRSETNIAQPENNHVTIADGTGYIYILDGAQPHVARRYKLPDCEKVVRKPPDIATFVRSLAGIRNGDGSPIPVEDLGTRVIEGVSAHGWRMTQALAIGASAGHGPVLITEAWRCEELDAEVLRIRTDPTSVQTDRLINITRAEPDPSLFQVPPDYRIEDEPAANRALPLKER